MCPTESEKGWRTSCLPFPGDHGQPQSPHSAPPLPLVPARGAALCFSTQMPRLDHPTRAAQLMPRAAAARHMDRRGGQRMERASSARLSPGARSCTPAQAGDKTSALITAEQEFDPVPEPFGLQSSPFLILPPAQPRGMQSRTALAGATDKGCFARPSSKAEVLLGHPQLPPQPPRPAGLSQLLTEGDGGDTGLLWQAPVPPQEPQLCFSSTETTRNRRGSRRGGFPKGAGGKKGFPLPPVGFTHPLGSPAPAASLGPATKSAEGARQGQSCFQLVHKCIDGDPMDGVVLAFWLISPHTGGGS